MKMILTILLVITSTTIASAQTIRIANNNLDAPTGSHIYANIQDAIDASSNGDIIHVIPSDQRYGNFTLAKRLTIIGIGYNPNTDRNLESTITSIRLKNFDSSGSKFIGLRFTFRVTLEEVENITFEKCFFEEEIVALEADNRTPSKIKNITFRNCIIENEISFLHTETTDILLYNNIITGSNSIGFGGFTVIANNVFFLQLQSFQVQKIDKLTRGIVSNNIFIGLNLNVGGDITNSVFTNNLNYELRGDRNFPSTNGNTESNNFLDQDPQFIAFPSSGSGNYSFEFNLRLRDSSPGKGAGSDGTDIGIYGGLFPFDDTGTSLPVIRTLNTPGLVNQGSDLQVEIKAQAH